MKPLIFLVTLLPTCLAQYGLYNGYGGYGGGYGGYGGYGMPYGGNPFMGSQLYGTDATQIQNPKPPIPTNPTESQRDCRGLTSMRSRSLCRYGTPMMGGMGGMGMYGGGVGGCMDMNPQCSVWASTGQCATNPMMMRQTCALSCGTCASGLGLGGVVSPSMYNPYGGLGGLGGLGMTGGLDQYPLSQFIGRSIYETGNH